MLMEMHVSAVSWSLCWFRWRHAEVAQKEWRCTVLTSDDVANLAGTVEERGAHSVRKCAGGTCLHCREVLAMRDATEWLDEADQHRKYDEDIYDACRKKAPHSTLCSCRIKLASSYHQVCSLPFICET